MPALNTLEDLFVHQLRDVYSAERQLIKALPKMAKNATSEDLKEALTAHLSQTEEHAARLDQVFASLGVSSRGMKCKAMEGLIEEGEELFEEESDEEVLDAAIIAASQRIEHYEIAAYGTLCEYARNLGQDDAVGLLQETLDEEKAADSKLTEIAESGINALANRASDEDDAEDADDASDNGRQGNAQARKGASSMSRTSASSSSKTTAKRK